MTQEEWRTVDGFEAYEVSNIGGVRRADTHRALKPQPDTYGYRLVILRGKAKRVHRLVAAAFVPGPRKPTVNHIDGNKQNNVAANLEWTTHLENVRHAIRIGLTPPPPRSSEFSSRGGKAVHAQGVAHRFSRDEQVRGGTLGGQVIADRWRNENQQQH
jgi:hypothetical protein